VLLNLYIAPVQAHLQNVKNPFHFRRHIAAAQKNPKLLVRFRRTARRRLKWLGD
jgi:hypothetical protein